MKHYDEKDSCPFSPGETVKCISPRDYLRANKTYKITDIRFSNDWFVSIGECEYYAGRFEKVNSKELL